MRPESTWRSTTTPSAAVNSGVAALSSAVNPVGSVRLANAMQVNGIAANVVPTIVNATTRPRIAANVRRPAKASRTDAPIASRISAAHTGPTSGAAIRRNRNAPPQTAPRNRSEARSTGVRLRG